MVGDLNAGAREFLYWLNGEEMIMRGRCESLQHQSKALSQLWALVCVCVPSTSQWLCQEHLTYHKLSERYKAKVSHFQKARKNT